MLKIVCRLKITILNKVDGAVLQGPSGKIRSVGESHCYKVLVRLIALFTILIFLFLKYRYST